MTRNVSAIAGREFRSFFDQATAYILVVVFLVANFFFYLRTVFVAAEATLLEHDALEVGPRVVAHDVEDRVVVAHHVRDEARREQARCEVQDLDRAGCGADADCQHVCVAADFGPIVVGPLVVRLLEQIPTGVLVALAEDRLRTP